MYYGLRVNVLVLREAAQKAVAEKRAAEARAAQQASNADASATNAQASAEKKPEQPAVTPGNAAATPTPSPAPAGKYSLAAYDRKSLGRPNQMQMMHGQEQMYTLGLRLFMMIIWVGPWPVHKHCIAWKGHYMCICPIRSVWTLA